MKKDELKSAQPLLSMFDCILADFNELREADNTPSLICA